jgi:hypothetical protein
MTFSGEDGSRVLYGFADVVGSCVIVVLGSGFDPCFGFVRGRQQGGEGKVIVSDFRVAYEFGFLCCVCWLSWHACLTGFDPLP